MHTFTINVAPDGKFLFRIENIERQKLAFDIANDMAMVYGKDAIRIVEYPARYGTPVPTNDWSIDLTGLERL